VQEFLRRYSIVSSSRLVTQDYTYEGVTMKKGEMVLMPSAFFNLDETRPEPIRVDFQRGNKKHITFGSGTHACAGALLAREEIRIFLEEWLTRMPQVRLDPERPPVMKAMSLNGAESLWLQWDA
jgi:cytochrome P450